MRNGSRSGRRVDWSETTPASVGNRGAFQLPHGRGDEFHNARPTPDPRHPKPRDMFIRDLHLDTIRVRTREFR